jgi:hypothetical protein
MTTKIAFLIIRADGDMRVVKRRPFDLRTGEVCFKLNVDFPDGWGKVAGTLDILMPGPPRLAGDVEVAR